ncbi:hypothetical protein BD779DRAFT_1675910 [Infundibulicybe gibba]|nr:hypothetical protein BD779DRAFT_1675910 [Infundibulicybe gibba]
MSDTTTQHFPSGRHRQDSGWSTPLTDYAEHIIKSQEEADKLHHAARAQRDTCEEAVKEAEAQISAAILRRQRAEEKLFQADRYVGKIRSLIHRTGFSCCPPDSTLARPPPLPVEIYGAERRISVGDIEISILLD